MNSQGSMTNTQPLLILINPWIYDFAAYDLWSKPLGLLTLATFLRNRGFRIHLIDCLDIHHPGMSGNPSLAQPARRQYGTGKFFRQRAPRPQALKDVPRSYSRYGISTQLFVEELRAAERPAAILVTSLMTYWYPGVQEVIRMAREIHPGTPVLLGGIYARLCREHALRKSGAHEVLSAADTPDFSMLQVALGKFGLHSEPLSQPFLYPSYDLLHGLDYVCIQTSSGCPFRCHYCASRFLNPEFTSRDPYEVLEEILFWQTNRGVEDFAFYDDALLVGFESHLRVLLEQVVKVKRRIRFHTPNALHVREITPCVANLLFASGFKTIRLGLETSDTGLHQDLDRKVSSGDFEKAVKNLALAGFDKRDIGAYILAGLPAQSVESVVGSVEYVVRAGATPYIAEYSPIPHTPLWDRAVSCSEYDLVSEPLLHNNTLLPCWNEKQRRRFEDLKRDVVRIRRSCG
jgi:radical SAM superfamily enzyme YgiQ (UPF0313 family)